MRAYEIERLFVRIKCFCRVFTLCDNTDFVYGAFATITLIAGTLRKREHAEVFTLRSGHIATTAMGMRFCIIYTPPLAAECQLVGSVAPQVQGPAATRHDKRSQWSERRWH